MILDFRRSGPPGGAGKDAKKLGGAGRGATTDDAAALIEDQTIPEAPKMVVFATIPHLQPTRHSSYSETADRSERLRRYNLNETFSTSMLLTSIRDIPLEPPPPPEYVPQWKLIRPKKPKVIPHAEPIRTFPFLSVVLVRLNDVFQLHKKKNRNVGSRSPRPTSITRVQVPFTCESRLEGEE